MKRIVIDSNVWISAVVFGGQPRRVFELVVQEGHRIILSQEIVTEVRRVLHKRFPDFFTDFDALLAVLALRVEYVPLGAIRLHVCRDSDDDRILETAVIGQADHIISGDNDLLELKQYETIAVILPSEAVSLLAGKQEGGRK